MTTRCSFCLIQRRAVLSILAFACLLLSTREPVDAQASCTRDCTAGSTCATYKIWDTANSNLMGFNPQSIQEDVAGITKQLSPAAPTMVTSMENTL